jgi:hypothetical protein
MSVPLPGAGDFLDYQLPISGAGNYLTGTFPGLGAGDFLLDLSFSVEVINNVILRQQGCRILTLSPAVAWADRSFLVSSDEDLVQVTPLTPGASYALVVVQVDPLTGADLTEKALILEVPASVLNVDGKVVASLVPRQFGILEALTFAAGKLIQSVGGVPACRVAEDASTSSSIIFATSTLGFPRSGFLNIEGQLLEYIDTCDTAFVLKNNLFNPVYAGLVITSDVRSIPPRRQQ